MTSGGSLDDGNEDWSASSGRSGWNRWNGCMGKSAAGEEGGHAETPLRRPSTGINPAAPRGLSSSVACRLSLVSNVAMSPFPS